MKWFRVYSDMVGDRKLRRLPVAQRWLWLAVLTAASDSPERGRLLVGAGEPVTPDDLADMANIEIADVHAGLEAFERQGMVRRDGVGVLVVSHWDERQYKSDNSTRRWHEWKERQSGQPAASDSANVGPNVGANVGPTDTDTDTDTLLPSADADGSESARRNDRPTPTRAKTPREPDALWDAVCDELGVEAGGSGMTASFRGVLNRAVSEIRKAGGTPEQVPIKATAYRRCFPSARLTAAALAKHWPTLGAASRASAAVEPYWQHRDPAA